ncbi:MAG TPA: hypothetical protein DCY95_13545 [Algoriphagus sp.]|jgi:competence protein ComEC|uniref:ComEC/Rec2 family competence protein n=3 Tax=Algoriphagus TaxID=246875 RepID=UPI000C4DE41D|nr:MULTISPECIES: ComEC/Rec2 family competence protein [unclassified Algoriphagus]MAL14271.1 hypothetical protein [Algoriphagus sp.]MAN88065.1 hypothetical protein [Algoriphagus sp.]HAH36902.1 hypothetical protein [Algoriphagus sp.]HAS60178.1 hypothetical protein [Algoriphagus sp.]HAZ25497.1 hypothetical protein [Algoriphagus sp.]
MRFSEFPFLRYLIFFLLGIGLANRDFEFQPIWVGGVLGILWIFYVLAILFFKNRIWIAPLAYAQLFLAGVFVVQLHQKPSTEQPILGTPLIAKTLQFDIEKPRSQQNLLQVYAYQRDGKWINSKEKILLYHQDSISLIPESILLINKAPELVQGPKNPGEFDYKAFLQKKEINYTLFHPGGLKLIDDNHLTSNTWLSPIHWRQGLANLIQSKLADPQAQKVAKALLLGQKDSLDKNIRAEFADAGVMHVLAVSGLHVGILVSVFLFLVKPFKLKGWKLKVYLIAVVIIIWLYAMITGFSPSVVRASVMFTLITLGQMRDRKPSIFNVLAFSAILMIAIDPEVIFEVGFQLSYVAVAGIVLLQPMITRWWLPSSPWIEYLWQLAAVSIAAQLATFPLTVFYFHNFPLWFLPANLLIIPLTFLIMQIGIPFLILGWIPLLSDFLGWVLNSLFQLELWILNLFKNIPVTKLDELTIFPLTMFCVWGNLLIWASWDLFPKKRLVYIACFLTFLWAGNRVINSLIKSNSQLIVYSGNEGFAFDYWDGKQLKSWNQGVGVEELDFKVKPNRILNGWGKWPESLQAFSLEKNLLFFPELELLIDIERGMIKHEYASFSKVEYWQENEWIEQEKNAPLEIGNSSVRILF